jgi:hypothetical protein
VKRSAKSLIRIVVLCVTSLASALAFCIGCSIHETNRWGQSEDIVTYLLAAGTYFSFLIFALSGVAIVTVLIGMKSELTVNQQDGDMDIAALERTRDDK